MASKDLYGAQSFVRDSRGEIGLGRFYPCKNADEARRTAEQRVVSGHAVGAAAFLRHGAGEFDEGEVITFAVYGQVPRGVVDMVPF